MASNRPPGDGPSSLDAARFMGAAKVEEALNAWAGPFGCRRFVVRFEHRGGRVRLRGLDAHPLAWGGGPPLNDRVGQSREALERALGSMWEAMSTGFRWERGAVAYIRDAQGRTEVVPFFNSEADGVSLSELPVPGPPGHPLEDPSTLALFGLHGRAMARIHAASRALPPDWDWWEVDDDVRLTLHYDDPPAPARHHRCHVLATFEPRFSRFSWHSKPTSDSPVFSSPPFAATFDAAFEVGLLASAILGAAWLMVQPYDEHDSQLLVAVFR